jgi:hypothetical protein
MDNNKLIELLYAASVACSQALVTYAQVRAQQSAVNKLDDQQIEELLGTAKTPGADARRSIGFNRK